MKTEKRHERERESIGGGEEGGGGGGGRAEEEAVEKLNWLWSDLAAF